MESKQDQCDAQCKCDKCSKNTKLDFFLSIMSKMMGPSDPTLTAIQKEVSNSLDYHKKTINSSQKSLTEEIEMKDIFRSQSNEKFKHIEYDANFFLPSNFERFILTGDYRKINYLKGIQFDLKVDHIFVIGCGRSGTTMLFNFITDPLNIKEYNILALNEPRELYLNSFGQQFDIWSSQSPDDAAINCKPTSLLINMVNDIFKENYFAQQYYIEKMPEHVLRIPEILEIFPSAKFIYMKRNWVEVAQSIESFGSSFNWYGYNNRKWNCLLAYVKSKEHLAQKFQNVKLELIKDNDLFVKGTIEWIICQQEYEHQQQTLSKNLLQLNYADLIINKEQFTIECKKIEEFTNLNIKIYECWDKVKSRESPIDTELIKHILIESLESENSLEEQLKKNLQNLKAILNDELLEYLLAQL